MSGHEVEGEKRDNPSDEKRETGTEGEGAAGQGEERAPSTGADPDLPWEPAWPLLPSVGYAGEGRAPEWKGDWDP